MGLLLVVGLAAVVVSDVVLALSNFVVHKYDAVLRLLPVFISPFAYIVALDIFAPLRHDC